MNNRIKDIYALFAALALLAVVFVSPQADAAVTLENDMTAGGIYFATSPSRDDLI